MEYTDLIKAVLTVITLLLTGFLIPWIRSKTTNEKREDLYKWAKIFVAAADQIYKSVDQNGMKKQYVLSMLAEKGFKFNAEEIEAALEAAVNELRAGFLK